LRQAAPGLSDSNQPVRRVPHLHRHRIGPEVTYMSTITRAWMLTAAAVMGLVGAAANAQEPSFTATLTGAAQLPDPTTSKATGTVEFVVVDNGKKINYTLTVTDLQNPVTAELHLGGTDMNGPAVVRLFPTHGFDVKHGSFTGVLAEGTITAASLLGSMQGSPLSDLIDEMRDGSAYVNIHTSDGIEGSKPGPGNYRLGEIRGQIAPK
jgi:hypothetical protein